MSPVNLRRFLGRKIDKTDLEVNYLFRHLRHAPNQPILEALRKVPDDLRQGTRDSPQNIRYKNSNEFLVENVVGLFDIHLYWLVFTEGDEFVFGDAEFVIV